MEEELERRRHEGPEGSGTKMRICTTETQRSQRIRNGRRIGTTEKRKSRSRNEQNLHRKDREGRKEC